MNFAAWNDAVWTRLRWIDRYSSLPCQRRENVAEHTFYVMMFCYGIALHLQQQRVPVNTEKLLRGALLHDIDESVTGDFIRSFKYSDSRVTNAIHAATLNEVRKFLEPVEQDVTIFHDWRYAKSPSLEGDILNIADLWSVFQYACQEHDQGSPVADQLRKEAVGWLRKKTWHNPHTRELATKLVTFMEERIRG